MSSCSASMLITPLDHGPEKKIKFGAKVTNFDLNNISDDQIAALREAILRYKVVVVKGQQSETPAAEWSTLERLDPEHQPVTQQEFGKLFHPTGEGIVAKLKLATVPNAGHIHLMGKGYQGDDHYGLKGLNLGEAFANNYYSVPLSEEAFNAGSARFQSWHMDGPNYKVNAPLISSLRYIKLPRGEQIIEWADGSGMTMKTRPGGTAFVSSVQLYEMLSDEEKMMADCSWAEHMHFPYEWIRGCHGRGNGLGVADEGLEVSDEEMGMIERDSKWTRKHPLVWINPVTGEKALQVQQNTVRKLFIRRNPEDIVRVIEKVEEVRAFLRQLQERIIRPEYVYVGPEEEGDHVFWANWSMMHSKIDYPIHMGPRIAHQGWVPTQREPRGPVAIPATA